MSGKEELNETNEILYGKKNAKPVTDIVTNGKPEKVKTGGDELMDEILYGKKKSKVASGEPKAKTDGDELMDEILYGKKKPKKSGDPTETKEPKAKTDGEDLMDEILYGKKKPKKSSDKNYVEAMTDELVKDAPKPKGKKFDRDEYFGL
jgi:hypothetical protein